MGDLKLASNPYEGTWKASISFSDSSSYSAENEDPTSALTQLAEKVHHEHPLKLMVAEDS